MALQNQPLIGQSTKPNTAVKFLVGNHGEKYFTSQQFKGNQRRKEFLAGLVSPTNPHKVSFARQLNFCNRAAIQGCVPRLKFYIRDGSVVYRLLGVQRCRYLELCEICARQDKVSLFREAKKDVELMKREANGTFSLYFVTLSPATFQYVDIADRYSAVSKAHEQFAKCLRDYMTPYKNRGKKISKGGHAISFRLFKFWEWKVSFDKGFHPHLHTYLAVDDCRNSAVVAGSHPPKHLDSILDKVVRRVKNDAQRRQGSDVGVDRLIQIKHTNSMDEYVIKTASSSQDKSCSGSFFDFVDSEIDEPEIAGIRNKLIKDFVDYLASKAEKKANNKGRVGLSSRSNAVTNNSSPLNQIELSSFDPSTGFNFGEVRSKSVPYVINLKSSPIEQMKLIDQSFKTGVWPLVRKNR